jgi:hypothetical protein
MFHSGMWPPKRESLRVGWKANAQTWGYQLSQMAASAKTVTMIRKRASGWLDARRVESFLGGISLRCCKSRRPLRKLAGRRDVRRQSTPRKSLCRFHSPGFARRNRPLPSTAPCYGPDKGAYPRHVTPSSRRTKRSCCSCTSERSFLSPGLKPRLPLAHMRARHALMQALQSGKRQ